MRKFIRFAVVLGLCLALCGCAAPRGETDSSAVGGGSEASGQTSYDDAAKRAEIVNEYIGRYGADAYWQDEYIEFRYFLVNGDGVVCLLAVPDAVQTTAIPFLSVARVEQVNAGIIIVVKVFDKSGGSIEINLNGEKAAELVKRLGK